jgi:hypothetical protein
MKRSKESLRVLCFWLEALMNLAERITTDPDICHGKPCIRGLRYPVEMILELLSSGIGQSHACINLDREHQKFGIRVAVHVESGKYCG